MKEDIRWAEETLKSIVQKMRIVADRSKDKIPYTTENGIHDDRSQNDGIGWWTNGFWGGLMWQLYAATGEESFRRIAEANEEKLDRVLINWNMLDHDNGFKWLPTAVAHYRVEKNENSKNRGMLAANNLAGRFNAEGGFIRAWNGDAKVRGWAIIDCMMNLPLLYWASEITDDPRFSAIAVRHAETSRKYFVREDGSVNHIVEFDPYTGSMIKTYGGQGMREGSSWTRGQAWGLYGFTLSYIHTKNGVFLETAKKIADYFLSQIPENGLIPVDFLQPENVTWQDSTAGAIAACGLLTLAEQVSGEKETYRSGAMKLLKALADNNLDLDHDHDQLIEKCSAAYNDEKHEFSIIYGDYFFTEALNKITGKELFVW
ncbi:MAG: glycoside hydrolase family 88 protein [Lachnospiraceae bacterium]|nr:glycoside hydrolase family 88 protein [Lachnospiraceae bacterium]